MRRRRINKSWQIDASRRTIEGARITGAAPPPYIRGACSRYARADLFSKAAVVRSVVAMQLKRAFGAHQGGQVTSVRAASRGMSVDMETRCQQTSSRTCFSCVCLEPRGGGSTQLIGRVSSSARFAPRGPFREMQTLCAPAGQPSALAALTCAHRCSSRRQAPALWLLHRPITA